MSIRMVIGLPGAGKTQLTVHWLRKVLRRNKKWRSRTKTRLCPEGITRKVYVNFDLKPKYLERWKDFIVRYEDPEELTKIEDADIFIDEVARYFDGRDWEKLSFDLRAFLQEHDKVGCDIYANTQTPRSVDVAFRRLCERVWRISKIIGSRRPSKTRPPIWIIWGICFIRELEPKSFSKEFEDEAYKTRFLGFFPWPFFWLGRARSDWYDTRQKIIPGAMPPLRHRVAYCEEPGCTLHKGKVVHI